MKCQVSKVRCIEIKYGFRIVAELENAFSVFISQRMDKFIQHKEAN